MTNIPINELRALGNLKKDLRLFELGNKKNPSGLYREWYLSKGIQYWCTDINEKDGAMGWDIREEVPEKIKELSPFDVVTNFGFTEHVQTDEGQEACWKNIHNILRIGGQLSCVLPQPGYWKKHGIPSGFPGIYYPYPEFFENFAQLNKYEIEDLWIAEDKHLVCCRMKKLVDTEFVMSATGMFKNI